jgi:hypothetical protein
MQIEDDRARLEGEEALATQLDQGDVDRAVLIMDRYYALERGGREDAARLAQRLRTHAENLVKHGDDLPTHEVNFEQAMVAPLLDLGRRLPALLVDPERSRLGCLAGRSRRTGSHS